MKRWTWVLAVGLFGLTACTTFRGISPIYPDVGDPDDYWPIVDSLQPILRWNPSPLPDVSYDLIVYEGIKAGSTWAEVVGGRAFSPKRTVGKVAYYRESLQEPQHKVDEFLKPDSEYYWSVRVRQGKKTSAWSLYDYDLFLVAYIKWSRNQLFRFKTPAN